MFVAMILTQVEYPMMYFDLFALKPAAIIVVAARNLVLVAVLLTSLVALWRLQAQSADSALPAVVLDDRSSGEPSSV